MDDVAVGVAQHLDLDVARPLDEALDEHAPVAEARLRLAGRAGKAFAAFAVVEGEPHALAAAAGGGLDHHRIADLARDLHRVVGAFDFAGIAGDRRHAGLLREPLRRDLVAHRAHRVRQRADERDARFGERLGEVRLLGQEAEAGMHGVGAAAPAGVHDSGDIEVGGDRRRADELDRLVGVAHGEALRVDRVVHGDAGDAQLAQRADDADRDFAAIGDQHLRDVRHDGVAQRARARAARRARARAGRAASTRRPCPAGRSAATRCRRRPARRSAGN